ncbi:BglG family transcription antiterminator [Enterococcus camelliae]|uniref:BglG family transcription antiterminator n=1 Tax=Enterococcus camelliae TaxID=453959 RepID=A0ABW5TJM5_9ENTE
MRIYSIIVDLFSASDYLPVSYFVNKYKVSKRTIQNDLSYLIKISSKKGFELYSFYGKGYLLEIIDDRKFHCFCDKLLNEGQLNSKKLFADILFLLLEQTGYISTQKVSEFINVSKSTVVKELKSIAASLQEYQLLLLKKSHYGIKISGEATQYKLFLYSFFEKEDATICSRIDQQLFFLKAEKTVVMTFLKDENLHLNYADLQTLFNYLKVEIFYQKNISKGKSTDDCQIIEDSRIRPIIEKIQAKLELEQSRFLMNGLQPLFFKYIKNNQSENTAHLKEDIYWSLQQIDKENSLCLSEDSAFIDRLYQHTLMLMMRMGKQMSYKNPFLIEFCIKYPNALNIALKFSNLMKQKYDFSVTNDELAFLAIHFSAYLEKMNIEKIASFERVAMVCSSGGGASYLMCVQIKKIFTQAVVQSFSIFETEAIDEFKPDIIFTIMPLSKSYAVPVIYITELLSNEDLYRIKKMLLLGDFTGKEIIETHQPFKLSELFQLDLFHVKQGDSYINVIKDMATELVAKGYANPEFVENVLNREKYMSTVYNEGVAIPHPLELSGKKNAISLTIIDPVMKENGKEIKLIFMICLTKESVNYYSEISQLLFQLMNDPEKLAALYSANILEEGLNILKTIGRTDL